MMRQRQAMAYSINRRPLLDESNSEFEDDPETEIDDTAVIVSDGKPFFKPHEPSDRYHLAYIIFYLLGMNTLIPWSFFITPDDYWMYKLREIHVNNTGRHNYTHTENLEKRSDLQASFTSYLSVTSALPNTIFLIVNTLITKKVSLSTRMIGSQGVILLLFILTTILVKINTDEWQNQFLIITLATVAIANVASAIFGGSLMGVAGQFSSRYITAMMGGQALGGIFTALAEIGSLWIGASPVLSGLLYFAIGDAILLLSLIAYIVLERAAFFKYHTLEKLTEQIEPDFPARCGTASSSQERAVSYTSILKKIWHYGVSTFSVFTISLAVYPAVTVLVESEDKGKGYAWNDVYFVPVVTYLTFSAGDYIGRILAGHFQWPNDKPWLVILVCLLRVLFIPAIMVCNAQPRHHLPVYIRSDVHYILITVAFAISNGYLCNLTLVLAPTVVKTEEKEIASAMMGAFLGAGLAVGSTLSLFIVKAV